MSTSRLFSPLVVGNVTLEQRIALAPLTRFRSSGDHVPSDLNLEYYSQRASEPGTLLVTEGTFMSAAAGGYANVPGIYTAAQAAAWRTITDAVHARGSFIFCQLWALGRAANPAVAAQEGISIKSASAVPIGDKYPVPEALTTEEIAQTVRDFAAAARLAIEVAGFDGVEIHAANGYLLDQFLQDTCNKRGDGYGGSVANRSRLAVEVVDAVVEAVGPARTAIRISPHSTYQAMGMADPVSQFSDLIARIALLGLAYLHVVQPFASDDGNAAAADAPETPQETVDFVARLWAGTGSTLLVAGGLASAADARDLVDERFAGQNVVAVFGRYFIANPDLVFRVREGVELAGYDKTTFYKRQSPDGYVDYPFSEQYEALHGAQARGGAVRAQI
ncbi:NADH:flavin oxidoreductase/NADH oxidase family protein-like protein [Lasiosphaeria miniovina]|uniref:NADH:flavin oxidoreductase/NADH oxidase family protein-like protein n=1 Tax=Lasiosphaeria miniovina TaxID=1954250 RepID=A0AA39ZR84_9PEZI|nr:NADH:flavin oxidoreductase/NADH oxidase family protein-like protein [Lasiosphaeria miniovina]KAK0702131.1 NADH:flavin oxidoreductase/NADH oxidase family protein-like protein [Lasiosphaeria miniovina]